MTNFTRRNVLLTLSAGAVGLSIPWPAFGQAAPSIAATKLTPTLVLTAATSRWSWAPTD